MCLYQQISIKCKHSECSLVNKIIKSNTQIFDSQNKSKIKIGSKQYSQKIITSQIQIPAITDKEILQSELDLYNPQKLSIQEQKPIIKIDIENQIFQQIRVSIEKLRDDLVEIKNNQVDSLKILKYMEAQIEKYNNPEQKQMKQQW